MDFIEGLTVLHPYNTPAGGSVGSVLAALLATCRNVIEVTS